VAVSHHQGSSPLVALFPGRLDVGFDIGLQSLGEHPPGPDSGDLVEVEQELFAALLILMYPVHRCILPADVTNVGFPIRLLEGKVHHVPQEIPNPQLRESERRRPAGLTQIHKGQDMCLPKDSSARPQTSSQLRSEPGVTS
jgi:hypothetical protein